jgi:NAD(P)-dependent dehydrogenase (short-subunit alcohol dehydrogenase family)
MEFGSTLTYNSIGCSGLKEVPILMAYDLTGKTVLVTGACGGIGYQTALELSQAGATTVLVCRDQARGEAARAAIAVAARCRVEALACDLASQKQVRGLAEEFKRRSRRLHVLINNAAVVPARRILTEDGLEMQFAVNHLAYFLLTQLLLDVLKASAPSRIVNVSSGMARRARLDFGNLQAEKGYRRMEQYARTKLLNNYFTSELARRLAGTGVTVNAVFPGFTATGLGRNFGAFSRFMMKRFAAPISHGADGVVYLAASPEVEGVSGTYFQKRKPVPISAESYDADAAARLWSLSEEMTELR